MYIISVCVITSLDIKVHWPANILQGRQHEPIVLKSYNHHQISFGHTGLVATKAGFVVCEHPFWEHHQMHNYVHDSHSAGQFGLAEIKCPCKYRQLLPEDSGRNSAFCCSMITQAGKESLRLKYTHQYYCQIQCQLAITKRSWCDFVIYTNKDFSRTNQLRFRFLGE